MVNPKIRSSDAIVVWSNDLRDLNNLVVLFRRVVPIHNKSQSYLMRRDWLHTFLKKMMLQNGIAV